jgi:hypothetical protein
LIESGSNPDPNPALFALGGFKDANKKYVFLPITVGTFTSVFKDNKSLRSYKVVETKVFLLVDGKKRIQILEAKKVETYGS